MRNILSSEFQVMTMATPSIDVIVTVLLTQRGLYVTGCLCFTFLFIVW
jgi:hypothetical protein